MNKTQAIDSISSLYPSDSEYIKTNVIGKQFMLEAIEETHFDWRDLPEEVLVRWAEKCEAREREQDRQMREKYR